MGKTDESTRTGEAWDLWREMYEANERTWTSALEQAMNRDEFGKSSGKMLEAMLAAQKAVRENMRAYLESVNVPTREDIARLGELVLGIEEKIDQLADRLDGIEGAIRRTPGESRDKSEGGA